MTTRLTIASVVLLDAGRLLTVRKRGTSRFMLPGGKVEPGEEPSATAIREVHEELRLSLRAEELRLLGDWAAPAANEPETTVTGLVFTHPLTALPVAAAEIAELRWHPVAHDADDLAPLLRRHVLPALRRRP